MQIELQEKVIVHLVSLLQIASISYAELICHNYTAGIRVQFSYRVLSVAISRGMVTRDYRVPQYYTYC